MKKKRIWVVVFCKKNQERKTSELGNCNHGDTGGFSSVCVCARVCESASVDERVGRRENCQLAGKTNRGKAMQFWWARLPAHVPRFDVMDSNGRTREEQGAVFCIGALRRDTQQTPTESLLCAISSTVFPPYWEESILLQTHVLRLSRLVAQQHHLAVAAEKGPLSCLMHWGPWAPDVCIQRGAEGTAPQLQVSWRVQKGWRGRREAGRLLAAVPAFDEQTSNQYSVH